MASDLAATAAERARATAGDPGDGSGTATVPARARRLADAKPFAAAVAGRDARTFPTDLRNGEPPCASPAETPGDTGTPLCSLAVATARDTEVVLAAGGYESAAVWLRSGLPNSSGQVGENLFTNPNPYLYALFDEEVRLWENIPAATGTSDFRLPRYDEQSRYAEGGYLLHPNQLQPEFLAVTLPGFGREHWQLMEQLPQERLTQAVRAATMMEAALDWTVAFTRERQAFGRAVSDFQNTRFKLAEIRTQAALHRVFVDRCIEMHLDGKLTAIDAAMGGATDMSHTDESRAFRAEFEDTKKKQDKGLDDISKGLRVLRNLGGEMDDEVKRQAPVMDAIDNKMDSTSAELRTANGKLKKVITQMRSTRHFCIDVILIFIILGISLYLYNQFG